MIIQPYRILDNEREDLSETYEFIIIGSKNKPYTILLDIDTFGETGLVNESCTCPHYVFRQTECKHIIESKKILKELGIITPNLNKVIK